MTAPRKSRSMEKENVAVEVESPACLNSQAGDEGEG